MRKLTLSDNSIVFGDVGYDPATLKFVFPSNIKQVEFEDGTILENSNYVEQE